MIQAPIAKPHQHPPVVLQPSYNAVKIDIHNPQVNAPGYCQNQPATTPVYSDVPESSVYEMPQQSIYKPQQPKNVSQPPAVQEIPSVPPPVVVQPPAPVQTPTKPEAKIPQIVTPASQPVEVKAPEVVAPPPPVETKAIETAAPQPVVEPVEVKTPEEAAPQTVEVKAPEVNAPKVDVNEFISRLTNPDYEQQASAMEAIAEMAQNSPEKATELLDVKVIDTLLGIMNKDTSALEGPTPQQLQAREKIMSGKQVTEAEMAEANKMTPMEQAERNKLYSVFTLAILQKLYGSEIEKMSNTVVPLTELPGAAGIVEQVKNNPNPMVRMAGIDALSYIQRPEYKQDLTTLFTIAKNDKDVNVQQAAEKALKKLEQVANPAVETPSAEAPVQNPEETKTA